jgi:serine/threonine-protein kinase
MVLEFIEGPTLQTELKQRRDQGQRFTLAETSQLFSQLAGAIDHAHARGVIHRDLKPGNIMFTADRQVKLTDFGIARLLDAAGQTMTGAVLGTLAYISPEQAQGQTVDKRSDIYSLGVILYELATGQVPFKADTPLVLMMAHANEPTPPPTQVNPELSPAVEEVILRAMHKNPDERYQTAGDLAQALEKALNLAKPEPLLTSDPGPSPKTIETQKPSFSDADQASLHRQLASLQENLRFIDERVAEYVEPTDVPLTLLKNKARVLQRIEELTRQLGLD